MLESVMHRRRNVWEALKISDLTIHDLTLTDKLTGVEHARPDKDGQKCRT